MALLFSDWLSSFPGVVLTPSFLFCPSHPEGRVVITGWLCLWWAVSGFVYKEAGLLSLASPLSSPRTVMLMGFHVGPLENAVWGCCCPSGSHPLPEKGPGAQTSPPPSSF